MPRSKWLILTLAGGLLCALLIAALMVGWIVFNGISETGLPVYKMDQVDSEHKGYRRSTLTNGNTVYVNDYEEYALLPLNTEPPQMIGRLPMSFGASGLYAIPGQNPAAYVLEYDPMYQQVYRNINHPPFDWRAATFQMMRLMIPAANPKEAENPLVIENVLTTLQGQTYFELPMQADGNYAGYENYTLLLFSNELPGLMVAIGVHVAADGQVYLAENIVTGRWALAGTLFQEWMNH